MKKNENKYVKIILIFLLLFFSTLAILKVLSLPFQKESNLLNIDYKNRKQYQQTITDPDKKIVYSLDSDPSDNLSLQTWIMNFDGTNKKNLNIQNALFSFKHPTSNTLFYSQASKDFTSNALVRMNLDTADTIEYFPLKHRDPQAITQLQINSLAEISPDNRYVIFSANFFIPCPEEQTEGGGCNPENDPTMPAGSYLLDLHSQGKPATYLGDYIMVTRWDMVENEVYVVNAHNFDGLSKINLDTRQVVQLLPAEVSFYSAYPLFTTDTMVVTESQVSDNQPPYLDFSRIAIVNTQSKKKTIIDEAAFADIQPFIYVSPDEKYLIYPKYENSISTLNLYNIKKRDNSIIGTLENGSQYFSKGIWVDSTHYVTVVYTNLEDGQSINSSSNYVILLDVETGEVKKIAENIYKLFE